MQSLLQIGKILNNCHSLPLTYLIFLLRGIIDQPIKIICSQQNHLAEDIRIITFVLRYNIEQAENIKAAPANMEKNDLSLISYCFYFLFTLLMVLTIRDSAQVHSVKG